MLIRKYKKIFFSAILLIAVMGFFHVASAQVDVFGGQQANVDSTLGLGSNDPRVVAANVIRIVLGFLGIIAVSIIIYAGWIWMTAEGNSEKIEKAKKILINASIGLLIILSAFAITTFILSKIMDATGGSSVGGPDGGGGGGGFGSGSCIENTTKTCGCNSTGVSTCTGGKWSPCAGEICGGGLGANCNSTTTPNVCIQDSAKCSSDLTCDANSCSCVGAPIIDAISPIDKDAVPNGAVGNFITVSGRYFGTSTGKIYFSNASGITDVLASFPNSVNPKCSDFWTENQVIVVVPPGAKTGAIRIVRSDGAEDTTDNNRGKKVPITNGKFEVNSIKKPGLCKVDPDNGKMDEIFSLQGAGMVGNQKAVKFGNEIGSTTANKINFVSSLEANAAVPNISQGSNSVFVSVDGLSSNALSYQVEIDTTNNPVIDYLDPIQGPTGQYVTIFGSKFADYVPGKSVVKFHDITAGIDKFADVSFPDACKDNWWHDTFIIIKVPIGVSGNNQIFVTNKNNKISNGADFSVIVGKPGPGLCALVPHNGEVKQKVEASGDNFNATQGSGKAEFYSNVAASAYSAWSNQSVSSEIPSGAATGPFKIITSSGTKSNSLPFTIGKCISNADCLSGEECCGGGSWNGICRTSGTCGDGSVAGCTYGWSFSTSGGTTTPLTCGGYSDANACLASGSCPNSPGECQTSNTNVVGKCGDVDCNDENKSCNGQCVYDSAINKCKMTGSGATCEEKTTKLGFDAVCKNVSDKGVWQIENKGTCPLGSYKESNGYCTVGTPAVPDSCDICAIGFTCQSGQCVINKNVCPSGASCSDNQCISGKATCECCCNIADNDATTKNNPGCCIGLTCGSTCGPDTIDDGAGFGKCMGCRVNLDNDFASTSPAEQSASDKACNCTSGSTRYCQIDTNNPADVGTCEDKGSQGASCSGQSNVCSPDNSKCLSNNCQNDCTCGPATATPTAKACDGDVNNAQCDPDNNLCGNANACDPISCTCKPQVNVGDQCKDQAAICTTGADSCGADYQCLNKTDSGCRCCCNPGDQNTPPQVNAAGLTCQPDKSPCDGGTRGLYCGCSSDGQCGNGLDGCGLDTCCRPRPDISAVEPAENSLDICRNPLIKITFDHPMNISSFSGNLILVGDYGTDQCPANSTYLATIDKDYNKSKISKLWNRLKNIFTASAQAIPGNFCAISGTVTGYNQPIGTKTQGILNFSPNQILEADKKYYVIAKGDASSTDNIAEGLISDFKIGMNNPSLSSQDFNSLKYYGKIWSFTTKKKTSADDGICRLESVKVDPENYLFQKDKNDVADDNFNTAEFDTINDGDKAFAAYALSKSGQFIAPTPGVYDWQWSWLSENDSIAKVGTGPSPSVSVVTAQNKKDAKTVVRANAKIVVDKINKPTALNKVKTGKTTVRLFLCANPWPPVNDPTNWPWKDQPANCSVGLNGSSCTDNNFEFYYCRDKGTTGIDDLPSINNEAPVIRGQYDQLLKEFFFLRSTKPGVSSIIATDQMTGGRVFLSWPPISGATGYKVYYGENSGVYTDTIDTQASSLFLNNLTDNKKYYFAFKSYDANRVDSDLSSEVWATPTDKTPPIIPVGLKAEVANGTVTISWNGIVDADSYKVYYGASSGSYGSVNNVSKATQVTLKGLKTGSTYYITVSAVDKSGNESVKASEINISL